MFSTAQKNTMSHQEVRVVVLTLLNDLDSHKEVQNKWNLVPLHFVLWSTGWARLVELVILWLGWMISWSQPMIVAGMITIEPTGSPGSWQVQLKYHGNTPWSQQKKLQWKQMIEMFKGEYGIQLDPCMVYHAAMNWAMSTLILQRFCWLQWGSISRWCSISWPLFALDPSCETKFQCKLQAEVKKIITDGSVQKLL